jgi:hypothetical protein
MRYDAPASGSAIPREYLKSTTWRLARSRLVRGWVTEICRQEHDPAIRTTLTAILLVEMSARARPERGLEWAASLVLRFAPCLGWRRRGLRLTLGPLQIRGGPWRRSDAISRARGILRGTAFVGSSIDDLARCWNGTAAATAGVLPYVEALRIAHSEAERLAQRVALDLK